jgi:peptidoglycan biosynthesis protein MviN/MurJ (putative lipid II flippase)
MVKTKRSRASLASIVLMVVGVVWLVVYGLVGWEVPGMALLGNYNYVVALVVVAVAFALGIIGRPPRTPVAQTRSDMRTNGFAIASLILGLVGLSVLAIIFGHVSRSQMRRTGESGNGLASWGLFLGYLELLATAGAIVYVLNSSR